VSLLNDIISTPSKRDASINELVEMGDLAWDALRMEAMCQVPDEVKDVWAKEDKERRTERWDGIGEEWNGGDTNDGSAEGPDSRRITNDWIQRRWWAKQALGYVHLNMHLAGANCLIQGQWHGPQRFTRCQKSSQEINPIRRPPRTHESLRKG
jgi:hypothetical protein